MTTSEYETNRKFNLKFYECVGYLLCGLCWVLIALAFFIPEFKNDGVLMLALLLMLAGLIIGLGSIHRQEQTKEDNPCDSCQHWDCCLGCNEK